MYMTFFLLTYFAQVMQKYSKKIIGQNSPMNGGVMHPSLSPPPHKSATGLGMEAAHSSAEKNKRRAVNECFRILHSRTNSTRR